jgi:quercetin dioxygenase-like cupin family protein
MTSQQPTAGTVYRFDEIEWMSPRTDGTQGPVEGVVGKDAYGRKLLAQGDGGFYTQVVHMPPGFEAPVHTHDHAEVFMVLEGDCTFGGQHMGQYDTTVVQAGQPYGFTAGEQGLRFLVVRPGKAGFTAVD